MEQYDRSGFVTFRTELARVWLLVWQWKLYDHDTSEMIAEGISFRRRRALAAVQSWERVYLRRLGLY